MGRETRIQTMLSFKKRTWKYLLSGGHYLKQHIFYCPLLLPFKLMGKPRQGYLRMQFKMAPNILMWISFRIWEFQNPFLCFWNEIFRIDIHIIALATDSLCRCKGPGVGGVKEETSARAETERHGWRERSGEGEGEGGCTRDRLGHSSVPQSGEEGRDGCTVHVTPETASSLYLVCFSFCMLHRACRKSKVHSQLLLIES